MGIYYFHIRDDLGLIEDQDGIELPDSIALLMEVIQSADEFAREAAIRPQMRFEVADAAGRTVLMTPVQQSSESWALLASLSVAAGSIH
ncbi:hypothetical protein AA309_02445 [Microvirga vignae]|uniref:DUF6894 domain-containing protein n=1 Tax=Microvirga vignae TaxID=1225564 RepID=A0A0H1RHE1_9HYPH|nr:hypothetical protein [Microvirga vignae]KLK94660.1 hypothetical protein AA309_02445 [Microvirga vignae]